MSYNDLTKVFSILHYINYIVKRFDNQNRLNGQNVVETGKIITKKLFKIFKRISLRLVNSR